VGGVATLHREKTMPGHRYAVGEIVRYRDIGWPATPTAPFEVLSRHGEDLVDPSYRLRDLETGALRLGAESELESKAGADAGAVSAAREAR
jgi:hypothetical protein